MIRVGFDITPHHARRITGAGRVVAGYVRALSRLADGPRLVLLGFAENFAGLEDLPEERIERRVIKRVRALGPAASEVGRWRGVRLSASRDELDLYHANLDIALPGRGVPVIYHLYDLARLDPEARKRDRSLRSRLRTRLRYGLANRGDVIVTISQASRADIAGRLGIDPGQIRVIHPGVEQRFFDVDRKQLELVLRRYGLTSGYALFVGQLGRQKNEGLLLAAWERAAARLPGRRLVFAGDAGHASPGFGLRAARVDAEILGRVADEDVPALIAGAGVLALTSSNEGFGLPVAEALAAGTPVIVGDRGALPEVAADAAVIVRAHDVGDLAEALVQVLDDGARAAELRVRARARGQAFRWERAAREMNALYREVAQRARRRP